MNLNAQQLADAVACPLERAQRWVDVLNAAMGHYQINTPDRQAHFLAQIGHESGALAQTSENLKYSAVRLQQIFPRYFTKSEAEKYQYQPMAIANRVYANRYGNGDEASGDGFAFRGRGLIQLTFKDNYRACGTALGKDLVANPDLLLRPELATLAAAWYWQSHGCNAMADAGEIRGITKAVNGGYNGLPERMALLSKASLALAEERKP